MSLCWFGWYNLNRISDSIALPTPRQPVTIRFRCSCEKQLAVEDQHAGKTVVCPGCRTRVRIPEPELDGSEDFELVEDEENPPADQEPVQKGKHKKSAESEAAPVEEVEAPKKKKKKKRKRTKRQESGIVGMYMAQALEMEEREKALSEQYTLFGWPEWVWGLIFCGFGVFGSGIAIGIIALQGYPLVALGMAAALGIAVPFGLVVLTISIFLSSMIGVGVNFGDIRATIPKSIGLVFVVTMISFIPFVGWIIAIPIWWLGLMFIFDLEMWETRVVFIINWGVNIVLKILILTMIVAAISKKVDQVTTPDPPSKSAPTTPNETKPDDFTDDNEDPTPPPAVKPGRRR